MSKATDLIRFGREVRAEMNRITWPTWSDTQRLTIMVVILAIIVGVYLAVVDTAIAAALAKLFGINY